MQNVHKHFAHDLCGHKDQGFDEDQNYEKIVTSTQLQCVIHIKDHDKLLKTFQYNFWSGCFAIQWGEVPYTTHATSNMLQIGISEVVLKFEKGDTPNKHLPYTTHAISNMLQLDFAQLCETQIEGI